MTIDHGYTRRRRLAILGGARGRILDRAPESTDQFLEILPILGVTAVMAGLSMFFALVDAVRVPVVAAALIAVLWTAVIFIIDRFLTASITSTRNVGKLVAMAAPRVIMASLIGIVIATPLVLRVFDADVTARVDQNIAEQSAVNEELLQESAQRETLLEAEARVVDLEQQAKTGRISDEAETDPRVAEANDRVHDLEKQVSQQQHVADQAALLYQCERDGTGRNSLDNPAQCSEVPGDGDLAAVALQRMGAETAELKQLEENLETARADLGEMEKSAGLDSRTSEEGIKAQAREQLPAARSDSVKAKQDFDTYAQTLNDSTENANGLLSRLDALHQISLEKPALGLAHLTIAGLFFIIELLPVLVKTLKAYGDPTHYEQVEREDSHTLVERAKVQRNEERYQVEQQSQLRLDLLQDMQNRELQLGKRANEHVASEMEVILDRALDEWSTQVQSSVQGTNP